MHISIKTYVLAVGLAVVGSMVFPNKVFAHQGSTPNTLTASRVQNTMPTNTKMQYPFSDGQTWCVYRGYNFDTHVKHGGYDNSQYAIDWVKKSTTSNSFDETATSTAAIRTIMSGTVQAVFAAGGRADKNDGNRIVILSNYNNKEVYVVYDHLSDISKNKYNRTIAVGDAFNSGDQIASGVYRAGNVYHTHIHVQEVSTGNAVAFTDYGMPVGEGPATSNNGEYGHDESLTPTTCRTATGITLKTPTEGQRINYLTTSLTFSWSAVPNATSYTLTVNGVAYPAITTTSKTLSKSTFPIKGDVTWSVKSNITSVGEASASFEVYNHLDGDKINPIRDFPVTTGGRYPAYRFYNYNNSAHIYTIDDFEKDTIAKDKNWLFEGLEFMAYSKTTASVSTQLKPIHRFSKTNGSFYYSTTTTKRSTSDIYEGEAFYALLVASSAFPDEIPVYEFYNKKSDRYYYQVSNISPGTDWVLNGARFQAFPAKADNSFCNLGLVCPVFRIWNKSNNDHLYILSAESVYRKIKENENLVYEGVAFYLPYITNSVSNTSEIKAYKNIFQAYYYTTGTPASGFTLAETTATKGITSPNIYLNQVPVYRHVKSGITSIYFLALENSVEGWTNSGIAFYAYKDDQAMMIKNGVNTAPTFTSSPKTSGIQGTTYTYTAKAIDAQGDVISYSLNSYHTSMTINQSTGVITWLTTSINPGNYSVVVKATDSKGLSSTQSFIISIQTPYAPVYRYKKKGTVVELLILGGSAEKLLIDKNIAWSTDNITLFYASNFLNNSCVDTKAKEIYRFVNKTNGGYVYVSSITERDTIKNTMASTYAYEGITFCASTTSANGYVQSVKRYYHKTYLVHWYATNSSLQSSYNSNSSLLADGTIFYGRP